MKGGRTRTLRRYCVGGGGGTTYRGGARQGIGGEECQCGGGEKTQRGFAYTIERVF